MVEPGVSRPTTRSGSISSSRHQLGGADSTVGSDDDSAISPSIAAPGTDSTEHPPPSHTPLNSKNLAALQPHALQQPAGQQALPSLHILTDLPSIRPVTPVREPDIHPSLSSMSLPRRTPSLRAALASAGSLSPASVLSSPQLAAMGDITPLPSPIASLNNSPWKSVRRFSQSLSRTSSSTSKNGSTVNLLSSDSSQMLRPSSSRSGSKLYSGIGRSGEDTSEVSKPMASDISRKHSRNRSLSEYVPPIRVPTPQRPVVVSGSGPPKSTASSANISVQSNNLHREQYLAVHRGIALPPAHPPTPPRSTRSGYDDTDNDLITNELCSVEVPGEVYSVRSIRTNQPRKYYKLRQLGHGTFSQVSLAVRMETDEGVLSPIDSDIMSPSSVCSPVRKLVAVKVIDYGPAGGADEERVEVSLKREVEILKSVNHPSLVQLKAFGSDEKHALLVLDYCPGGDLFEFVTSEAKALVPDLIRRIFAELVAAVRYLHSNFIVHRDIKLENVLVTLPASSMQAIKDWRTYNRAVVTLSDLGLSRRIPEPPESPLLHTRCGSEDYAAPEILMGQPYDGRSTDAWALGVLLYTVMEHRLPFDALPGTRGDPAKLRARTPHRIARCEWAWYRYADSDGEWDPVKGKDLEGARECVEALLKRNSRRKSLDEIAELGWVRDAIDVPGGLQRGDKEVP
ncbi:hypothetical protein VTN00DRAFT_6638 [Thermoascus crustaceus]|uniref:uncharacterized protein n=1 Tax=Thermoascus crustaceus TaxID=5088 RepID=UPI0037428244